MRFTRHAGWIWVYTALSLSICTGVLRAQTGGEAIINTSDSPHAALRTVDLDSVRWTGGFWGKRFQKCHQVMVPAMWKVMKDPELAHAWQNFCVAAGIKEGKWKGTFWVDGDFYKWLEAAAYVYAVTGDAKLDRRMDRCIEVIAKAQAEDGYLSTPITIGHGYQDWRTGGTAKKGLKRWENKHHHELYNMGHLMTAGCIHHRATGKKNFLEVAKDTGDYLYNTFKDRPKKLAHFGMNPSNIMGAAELYRTTGNKKYLKLARTFVNMRGSEPGGTHLNQTRWPLRKAKAAYGHAVMANYLYSGAADVYMETGEEALLEAEKRLWKNVTQEKMYITGATGNCFRGEKDRDWIHEAYGKSFRLPQSTFANGYSETCANIANAMWNWRLLTITGNAKYADVMERALYNSVLSGISIDGKKFFYTNPQRRFEETPSKGWDRPTRTRYIRCYCCPPNVVRTIAKVHGWAYQVNRDAVWVNLFGASVLDTTLPGGGDIRLKQQTQYPWSGKVTFTVQSAPDRKIAFALRIPGWAESAEIRVNGSVTADNPGTGHYYRVKRRWNSGDTVTLTMPMEVKLMTGHPLAQEVRGQVAVQRGPIVYCVESVDLPKGVDVSEVIIPSDIELKPQFRPNLLGGGTVLKGKALAYQSNDAGSSLYRELGSTNLQHFTLQLIPYYAWANRGESQMTVWMPLNR